MVLCKLIFNFVSSVQSYKTFAVVFFRMMYNHLAFRHECIASRWSELFFETSLLMQYGTTGHNGPDSRSGKKTNLSSWLTFTASQARFLVPGKEWEK